MNKAGQVKTVTIAALLALASMASKAVAAQCGSTAAGFETWKQQFASEARGKGVSASALAALMGTAYSTATIAADRGQRSFRLSLDQFLAKRGGSAIVARGRALKQSNAALFASIQQPYGAGHLGKGDGLREGARESKPFVGRGHPRLRRPISPTSSTQL